MSTLKLRIVTPERVAYEEDVEYVSFPTAMGEIGVLPNHVPLIAIVQPGEVVVRNGNIETPLAVGGGFAEVMGGHVSILTDVALTAEEIDPLAVEEAIRRAKDALEGVNLTEEQIAAEKAALAAAFAQMKIKQKRGVN